MTDLAKRLSTWLNNKPESAFSVVPDDAAEILAALKARDEIRREALREAAEVLNHKAFLCHAHDDFGRGRERGFLDSEKEVLALAEKEGA